MNAASFGLNMKVMVNLSGRGYKIINNYHGHEFFSVNGADYLNRSLDNVHKNGNGRLLVFTNLDFLDIHNPDWTRNTVAQLEKDVKNGASGLKILTTRSQTKKKS